MYKTAEDGIVVKDTDLEIIDSTVLFNPQLGEYKQDILEILLPDSVTNIDTYAFANMTSLRQISLPASLKKLVPWTFENVPITGLVCGKDIKEIGQGSFKSVEDRCVYISDLVSWCEINFTGENANPLNANYSRLYVNGELVKDLFIPEEVKEIKNYAFCNGTFNKVVANHNITDIGEGAFTSGCDIELYGIDESIKVADNAMDGSTVYVTPDIIAKFTANDSWPKSGT